jgi:hypothetical protein
MFRNEKEYEVIRKVILSWLPSQEGSGERLLAGVGAGGGGRGSAFKSQKALLRIYILISGLWKCNYAALYIYSVGRVDLTCTAVLMAAKGWGGGVGETRVGFSIHLSLVRVINWNLEASYVLKKPRIFKCRKEYLCILYCLRCADIEDVSAVGYTSFFSEL